MFYFDIVTRSEFPSLSSQSRSSVMKDQSPLNRQKSQVGRLPVSSAATARQSGKGKAEATNKQTGIVKVFLVAFFKDYHHIRSSNNFHYAEAMDFRDWCEGEWARLTGTNGIKLCLQLLLQVRIIQSFVFTFVNLAILPVFRYKLP